MGLIDVLNGMQNGPRGQRDPRAAAAGECRQSRWRSSVCSHTRQSRVLRAVNRLLLQRILAYRPVATPSTPTCLAAAGGLGDLLSGGLGGLLAGGAAGSILSGGLNDLLKQFQQSGQSDTVNSWVGTGPNKTISPNDLASALGSDKINALIAQTGMSRDDLLHGLSEYLPQVVDQLTPQGRLPTEQEAHRML